MIFKIEREVENPGQAQDLMRAIIHSLNQGYSRGAGWSLEGAESGPEVKKDGEDEEKGDLTPKTPENSNSGQSEGAISPKGADLAAPGTEDKQVIVEVDTIKQQGSSFFTRPPQSTEPVKEEETSKKRWPWEK